MDLELQIKQNIHEQKNEYRKTDSHHIFTDVN